jgi:hypothetical protein
MTKVRGTLDPPDDDASSAVGYHERASRASPSASEAWLKGTKYLYGFDKIRKWESEERQLRFHNLVKRCVLRLLCMNFETGMANFITGIQVRQSTCVRLSRTSMQDPNMSQLPTTNRQKAFAENDTTERSCCSYILSQSR